MPEKRINLYLNPYQTELLEKIREENELVAKTDNEVIRFIIESYYKQIQELSKARELIKTKLNFISKETSLTLNSLLNLIAQQNIDITKTNDQMIQYHQAKKLFNNEIVGQKNPNHLAQQYSPEEIEAIKRQQREEQRKELAKKMKEEAPVPSQNEGDDPFHHWSNTSPF